MSIPRGYEFRPTDAELITKYLRPKCKGLEIEDNFIPDMKLQDHEPWDFAGKAFSSETGNDDVWFFFRHLDEPKGTFKRATNEGYWNTNKRTPVKSPSGQLLGYRKSSVFYKQKGKSVNEGRITWGMHEFTDAQDAENMQDSYVLHKVFKNESDNVDNEKPSGSSAKAGMVGSSDPHQAQLHPDESNLGTQFMDPEVGFTDFTSHLTVPIQMPIPRGYEFRPTDAELVTEYLRPKCKGLEIEDNFIPDMKLQDHEPWDFAGKAFSSETGNDDVWFFFRHLDEPKGTFKRATNEGYWNTNKRTPVKSPSGQLLGYRKSSVFYKQKGKSVNEGRITWGMHEFTDAQDAENMQDSYVLHKVFKNEADDVDNEQPSGSSAKARRMALAPSGIAGSSDPSNSGCDQQQLRESNLDAEYLRELRTFLEIDDVEMLESKNFHSEGCGLPNQNCPFCLLQAELIEASVSRGGDSASLNTMLAAPQASASTRFLTNQEQPSSSGSVIPEVYLPSIDALEADDETSSPPFA